KVEVLPTPQTAVPPQASIPPSPPTATLIGKTLLDVVVILAVAIIVPLVSLVGLFLLLGRHAKRFGPLVRIEYSGTPMVVGPYRMDAPGGAEPTPPSENNRFAEALAAENAEEITAEQFDIGPSFEEERLLKEEQVKQQEDALLQQLFEDNLRMYDQLDLTRTPEDEPPSDGA
ncbi:MAG TPA: hypothetical protein VFE62_14145, partial [Gemmataceae bacterium]|nr:hypothetical protein [Gemmataceae bacterium]